MWMGGASGGHPQRLRALRGDLVDRHVIRAPDGQAQGLLLPGVRRAQGRRHGPGDHERLHPRRQGHQGAGRPGMHRQTVTARHGLLTYTFVSCRVRLARLVRWGGPLRWGPGRRGRGPSRSHGGRRAWGAWAWGAWGPWACRGATAWAARAWAAWACRP
jgi:hypothetical protein